MCQPTTLQKNKTNVQQNQMQQREQEGQALLQQSRDNQGVLLQNKMEKKQNLKTYAEEKDTYQKEWPLSSMHKLDFKVFNSIKGDLKTDRGSVPKIDVELNTFINEMLDVTKIRLTETDTYQKAKGYKSVHNHESMMKKGFSFSKYVLPKGEIDKLKDVDETDEASITKALMAVDTALTKCGDIKTKARQTASDYNFTESELTKEQMKKINNLQSIWDLVGDFDKTIEVERPNGASEIFGKSRFRNYKEIKIKFKKADNKVYDMSFDWDKVKIIRSCMVGSSGMSKRSMQNTKELKAFTDEMTQAIAGVIAEFLSEKYNIDPTGGEYQKLLTHLASTRYFNKDKAVINVENLKMKAGDHSFLKELNFSELFEAADHDLLKDLLKLRDYSEAVLEIEEDKAFQDAGCERVDSLAQPLVNAQNNLKNILIVFYEQVGKNLDANEIRLKNTIADPDTSKELKDSCQEQLDDYIAYKQKLLSTMPDFDLKGRSVEDIKLTEIASSGKTLNYEDIQDAGLAYLNGLETMKVDNKAYDMRYCEATKSIKDFSNEFADLVKVSIEKEKNKDKETNQIRTTHINITDEAVRKLDLSLLRFKHKLSKVLKQVCFENKSKHPELEDYASGSKIVNVDKLSAENLEPEYALMVEELKKNDMGAVLLTTYFEVFKASKAIDKYRTDLEDIINKREDIAQYYSNITGVEDYLECVKTRLENTYQDPAMHQEYLKAAEFKDQFETMLAMPAVAHKDSKSDQDKEQLKIEVGRKTYKMLERFEKFKDELAENDSLKESVQGRRLIEKTVRMQESLVDKLVEEKKEELAFYEGSLLKTQIDAFKEKNSKIVEKIENLRQNEDLLAAGNAESVLAKYVDEHNALMGNIDAYLERYTELKNNSYYVKQVAVVKEAMTRQLRSFDHAKLLSAHTDMYLETEAFNYNYKGSYKYEDKLADKYKAFVERLSGRNKFGSYKNDKELDKDVDKLLELKITDNEIVEGLDSVLDIALVTERMQKAGLDANIIMQKMQYPGNIMQDINAERGLGTFISVLSDNTVTKEWFKKKADQFVEYYKSSLEIANKKAEPYFKDRNKNAVEDIANYLVAQSQVGIQLEVLQKIGNALKFEHKDFDTLYAIDLQAHKKKASQTQGFEEEHHDIRFCDGMNAYKELKADNNREVAYKKQSKVILDKINDFNDELGKDGLAFTEDYNLLLKVEKLRSSNSKEFDAVKDAATVVNNLSAEMKSFVKDPQSYSQKAVKEKLKVLDQAYDALLKATGVYITTRSTFFKARFKSGKDRLAAIKEIQEHAIAQRAEFAKLEAPLVEYKKDETIDVSAYVQQLKDFQAHKRDMFYDSFIDFKERFKDLLNYNGSEDTLDSTAGVNFFADLKAEEDLLKEQAVKEIVAGAEKIRMECTKTDAKANRASMYAKWIRCFGFCKKYEESCPQDAKEAVSSIKVLARDYLNGREVEGVVTNLQEEKATMHNFALKIKNNLGLSKEDRAQVMWLRFRYDSFISGIKKYKDDYKKDPDFLTDYNNLLEDFELINKEVSSYTKDPEIFQECMQSAKTKVDDDLIRAREIIANHAYVLADMKGEAALTIKNALEGITYFFSLYVHDKKNSGISEDEIKFYNAQKNNLQELLTSNVARMLVEEDYGAAYKKNNSADNLDAGYVTSLKNIIPVDKRMKEYTHYKYMMPGKIGEEKVTKEKQLSHTLRYIVQVEAENAQLKGVETLSKTSPQMAKELENQLKVRTQFEKKLVRLNKEKNKEEIAVMMKAMVDTAGDYYKLLKNKENKILDQQMNSDQERMLYYFTSYSKYYDEAKIYLTMMKKWSHSLGIKLTGSNYAKLADIVGRIDLKAQETIRYNHLTEADLNTKKKIDNLKSEATLAAYATQKICKERDQDFAYTMEHIRDVKLNSTNSFRANDLVKNSRKFGGDESYNSLKVEKSKNFTLCGFTLWGKVDRSLNDFIARVYKYTVKYEELSKPLQELIELAGYLEYATHKDQKTQEEAVKMFTTKVQTINHKLVMTTSEMIEKRYSTEHRRSNYRLEADRRYIMEGWTEFYQIFKELGKQLKDYVDRNPSGENAILNENAKKQHDSFVNSMAKMGTGATDIKTQEQRFFEVMKNINENQYAESAYEHSCNVEYTMYRDYLMSWFENLCYKEAQSTLRAIDLTSSVEAANQQYGSFLKGLERYAASKAISRKTHDYLKSYVFNACKKKYDTMQDKSIEELAKIRADVIFENAIADVDIESFIRFTNESREKGKELGTYDARRNKTKAEVLGLIKEMAYSAVEMEMRGQKIDNTLITSKKLLEDGTEFLAGAEKVTKSVGGWWFVLKNYFNYAIGEYQAAYFKVKNA